MKVAVKMRKYSSNDIKRELDNANADAQRYFDLMYQTLQFSFAAVIAVVGFGFAFFSEPTAPLEFCSLLFSYILPICLYVFGIMYAYNAYALALCGKKSEILHSKLYKRKESEDSEFNVMMKKHVISSRYITLLAYGVPLGFFLLVPIASVAFSCIIYDVESHLFGYHILPVLLLWVYLGLMATLIVAIAKNHFVVTKLQNHLKQ